MPGYELTEDMEIACVRQVLGDPSLLPRLAKHVRPDRFEKPLTQLVFRLSLAYFRRMGAVPTRVAILQEVRSLRTAGQDVSVEEVADFLERASSVQAIDSPYIIERIMSVERHEAIFGALEKGMQALRTKNYDSIRTSIEAAYAVGHLDTAPAQDFRKGALARSDRRRREGPVPRWGLGIPEVDDLVKGLAEGELGTVLALTKGGKSFLLGHIAMFTIALGGTCVYFTTEMSEQQILDRQDAAVSRIPIDDLHRHADLVDARLSAWLARVQGGMKVKKIPKGSNCKDLEAHLDQMRIEEGVEPDVLVVDYADEMDAINPRKYDRRDQEMIAVHSELRDLCERRKTRGWTASQATVSEALEKKNPTIADMAGARGKAFIDDLVLAICRTPEEKIDGFARFFVAVCRFKADGIQTAALPTAFPIGRIVASIPWIDDVIGL